MVAKPFILNIETSTDICSVAISRGDELIAEEINDQGRQHASLLPLMVERTRIKAGIELRDLHAIAFSMGPGSYTGLRVGLSTAKGLCFGLDLPLIGVDTLHALAHCETETKTGTLIITMIDARRDEVYMSVYDHQYVLVEKPSAVILKNDSLISYLDQGFRLKIVGNGNIKAKRLLSEHPFLGFGSDHIFANMMIRPSFSAFSENNFIDTAYAVPNYLKEPNYLK